MDIVRAGLHELNHIRLMVLDWDRRRCLPALNLKHLAPYRYERQYLEIAQGKHKSTNVKKT